MRKIFVLLLSLLSAIITSFAQTQQGYVKTKGRLGVNETVIPGSRISGATVQVKGRSAVLSQSNGTFSFPIPAQSFYLQSVQKLGYTLTDPDVLSKQYAYSTNPLVLVLETLTQQTDDKLAAERKIRRTLQRQLQEKEDEIESLKAQQKLSEEEYRKQLQEIYTQQESNEKLISEMADRYSRMDFDEVDEFNRRISSLILEGKLTEADSLLNTKGDIYTRAVVLRQHQEANAQVEQEIKKKQKKLEKSKELTQKELEDLAKDCYSKFEIFKMQHQNDSATYYIELRANLDSTNVIWLLEVANFEAEYKSDYDKAEHYAQKALYASIEQFGDESEMVAYCLNDLGNIFSKAGYFDKAIESFKRSSIIRQQRFGKQSEEIALCFSNIGKTYEEKDAIDSARFYYDKALQIREVVSPEKCGKIAESYLDIGQLEKLAGNSQKALEYYHKALPLILDCEGELNDAMLELCNAFGSAYVDVDSLDVALDWYNRALNITKQLYGEIHPSVAVVLSNIGHFYLSINHYEEANNYEKQALDIRIKTLGVHHPDVGHSYNNLAVSLFYLDKHEESFDYMKKALDLDMLFYGENSSPVANDYLNYAVFLANSGQLKDALDLNEKALSVFTNIYGNQSPKLAQILSNIADVYHTMKNYQKAIEYHLQAIEIYKAIYGENHSSLIKVYNNLSRVYGDSGNHVKEIEIIQKTLNISLAVFGKDNNATATLYSNLCIAYYNAKDYSKAVSYNQKAKEIKEKLYGVDSYQSALENVVLGRIWETKEDYPMAIKAYSDYLNIARPYRGDESREIIAHISIVYDLFYSLISKSPSQENIEWFQQFISDKNFVMIPVEGGPASQKGLKGEYNVLQYFDWNILDVSANFFDVNSKVKSFPKKIVLMNHDGNIESYEFGEPTMGVQFLLKYIEPEQKKKLIQTWERWKQK